MEIPHCATSNVIGYLAVSVCLCTCTFPIPPPSPIVISFTYMEGKREGGGMESGRGEEGKGLKQRQTDGQTDRRRQ